MEIKFIGWKDKKIDDLGVITDCLLAKQPVKPNPLNPNGIVKWVEFFIE